MYYKFFIILSCFFFNINLFAKTSFLVCDDYKFKISLPIIGFDKIYIKTNTGWNKLASFEITNEDIIIYDLDLFKKKCSNQLCTVNMFISKRILNSNFLDYYSVASNDKCEIDGSGICYKRPLGKSLAKGYCKKVNNID